MSLKKIFWVVVIVVITTSCSVPEAYLNFVQENKQSSFEEYKGYGIFQRGDDGNGNSLVYISRTLDSDTFINSGNIKIALDSTNQVVFVDSSEYKFEVNIDTLKNVAVFFNSLNINVFSADYNGNVYFSLFTFDQCDLMKVNMKSPPKEFKVKDWKELDVGWYLRK